MSAERLEPGERKCIRMGLICPCGTVSEQEEGALNKTACAGVSTQEQKDPNKKHHHKRQDSPSKRPLVASGDSTDSFRRLESHRQSKGISCTPGEIKKTTRERNKRHEQKKERRSRSSHHDRTNVDGQRPRKHHHRHHSSEGNAKIRKSTTLTKSDDRNHKQYGGTDLTKLSEIQMSAPPHSTKPCKEKMPKVKSLPVEKPKISSKEEKHQTEVEKKCRKPRSKAPAYVIPMAPSLK